MFSGTDELASPPLCNMNFREIEALHEGCHQPRGTDMRVEESFPNALLLCLLGSFVPFAHKFHFCRRSAPEQNYQK